MNRFLTVLITLFLLSSPLFMGMTKVSAHSISPLKQEVRLTTGERTYGSVTFRNDDSKGIEVKLHAYAYNSKTEDISEESNKIFLKLDTDTVFVESKESKEIRYEIYPFENLELGTYFNIVTVTPVTELKNVTLQNSIAQLVVLHIITSQDSVKGITTTDYTTTLEVVDKGIPFFKPTILKYSIQNDSNYILKPEGTISILNEKVPQKPYSFPINQESKLLYPGETVEGSIEVEDYHILDTIFDRKAVGHFYSGLDSTPKDMSTTVGSFRLELLFLVATVVGVSILIKSIRDDNRKD